MWNNNVTLYIDDTSIRMLVLDGQRVRKWAETPLDAGLVKGGVVAVEGEVAAKIKELMQSNEVSSNKVILGFSGLHSLTRPATLPVLPRNMLPEAVAREARRVLPVPLDQLYLSWRLAPSPKEKINVFLAATPRKAADSLIKTLRIAGLAPYQMAIKPLALTRALPVNTAVLVDVQSDEFDVVVLSDGIAHPIRTVTFPNTEITWEKKLEMIASDVDRTIKFFNANNAEKPLTTEVPVYVSGGLISNMELQQSLGKSLGLKVQPLQPLLKGADQIDLSRFMVNIALSLKTVAPVREPTSGVANLNMLPAPYQPKPISTAKLIGIPSGAAVIGILVPMVMMMQSASANITSLQSQLNSTLQVTTQKTEQKAALTKSITDLQKQSDSSKVAYQNLKLSLDSLVSNQEIVNGDIRLTLDLLPASMRITSITEADGGLSLRGEAPTEADILSFARDLDLSNRFAQTTVASLQAAAAAEGQSPTVQFNLVMLRKG